MENRALCWFVSHTHKMLVCAKTNEKENPLYADTKELLKKLNGSIKLKIDTYKKGSGTT